MLVRLAAILLLTSTTACTCGRSSVVAVVGDTSLTPEDLQHHRERRSDDQSALADLVERTLLAEAAREDGLRSDPVVAAKLRAAEREVLAQEYLESRLQEATSEPALRALYDETKDQLTKRRIHVQHIAIRIEPSSTAQQRTKNERAAQSRALRLYAALQSGQEFAEAARLHSEDAPTAARAGELGEILEGHVDPTFFEAAAKLRRGEMSQPIRTPYGFHVIRALQDADVVTPSFEQVRATLAAEARRKAEAALLEELRDDIRVKVYAGEGEDVR